MTEFQGPAYSWGSGPSWCEMYVQAWLEYYGMTEKKTFKNPELTVFQDGSGWKITPPGVTQYSGNHIWLPANEWDMEVTFTKKPKQFQPGDKVNFADETEADWYPFGMTVLAQHKGMAVVYNPADEIEVYDSEILTKI